MGMLTRSFTRLPVKGVKKIPKNVLDIHKYGQTDTSNYRVASLLKNSVKLIMKRLSNLECMNSTVMILF